MTALLRCLSQVDHESVVGRHEGDLILVLEYVGGHVGDDDALGGEPVPMGVEALYSQTAASQISTPARTSRTTFSQITLSSPRLR
ncbi:MAG: hypothetical protein ABR922_18425 [Streptosporangiaceae bacterium]